MKHLTIVIGQSASGKTTFVKKMFLKDEELTLETEPIKHTTIEGGDMPSICLLGDYTCGKRCLGTDTLSMSILPKLIDFIKGAKDDFGHFIVEGDRIANEKFFRFAASLSVPVTLYVFSCTLQESINRRVKTGSNPSETFVKTTITKTSRMAALGRKLGWEVIRKSTSEAKRWW